jgi:hypothetical protein
MTDPDDPNIQSRHKYALIIGLDSQSPESYLLLTTSRLDKLAAIRARMPDAFKEFQPGDYEWVTTPTVLDLRKVRCYSREELEQKILNESLTFECILSNEDMRDIEAKLRLSKTIEVRTLRKIVDLG